MEWRWKNFSKAELACSHCGVCEVDPGFMDRLQALRTAFAKPMTITSGYRCPRHNAAVSSTGQSGPHTTGHAVDVAVRGADAHAVLKLALGLGFTGIGVSQKGASRFIHLDDLVEARPAVWSY